MPSTPYYGPNEPASEIFLERSLMVGFSISVMCYGVQITLYTSCIMFLWNVRRSRRSWQSIFPLVCTSLLICVQTVLQAVQAATMQMAYIDNRNFPGGPWVYFIVSRCLPIDIAYYAIQFISTFLADILVLWRCWVIWSISGNRMVTYTVIAFPSLVLVGSFVMGTLWTLQSTQPRLSFYTKLPVTYGTSYYILSLGVNILLTILITIRLLLYRRQIVIIFTREHGRHYFSLVTIIIESAALYSVFALIFIIMYALENPTAPIFLCVSSSAQQIASYLIIYRVAQGRAWNQSTISIHQDGLSLRFQDLESREIPPQIEATLETPTIELADFSKTLTNSNSRGLRLGTEEN